MARSCLRPRSRGRGLTGAPSRSMRVTSTRSIAGDPAALRFSIDGATLKPFYESYGRYSVYLHVTLK